MSTEAQMVRCSTGSPTTVVVGTAGVNKCRIERRLGHHRDRQSNPPTEPEARTHSYYQKAELISASVLSTTIRYNICRLFNVLGLYIPETSSLDVMVVSTSILYTIETRIASCLRRNNCRFVKYVPSRGDGIVSALHELTTLFPQVFIQPIHTISPGVQDKVDPAVRKLDMRVPFPAPSLRVGSGSACGDTGRKTIYASHRRHDISPYSSSSTTIRSHHTHSQHTAQIILHLNLSSIPMLKLHPIQQKKRLSSTQPAPASTKVTPPSIVHRKKARKKKKKKESEKMHPAQPRRTICSHFGSFPYTSKKKRKKRLKSSAQKLH